MMPQNVRLPPKSVSGVHVIAGLEPRFAAQHFLLGLRVAMQVTAFFTKKPYYAW